MESIVNLISNVGFPIAMCLVIMYYWNNQFNKAIDRLEQSVSQLTQVVNQNTQAINLLRAEIGEDMDEHK